MENAETMQKILSNLATEFDKINEMWVYTKDMEEALKNGDEQTFGLLLDMRKKLMDAVDVLNDDNKKITDALPQEAKDKIDWIFTEKNPDTKFDTVLEMDVFEAKKRIANLLKKLVVYNAQVEKMLNDKRH